MKEVSAGIVIVSEKPRKYLLLHCHPGHWDFAKGKIERGETAEKTAIRETEEETGVTDIEILPGFKEEIHYFYKQKGELVNKTVTFFLGFTKTKKIKLSHEHKAYEWLPYDKAVEKLTFKTAKEVLIAANKFLEAKP